MQRIHLDLMLTGASIDKKVVGELKGGVEYRIIVQDVYSIWKKDPKYHAYLEISNDTNFILRKKTHF